jgi:hypothetical protein
MPQADFTEGLHTEWHRDSAVRARDHVVEGQADGYGEWFCLDGTRLPSGALRPRPSTRSRPSTDAHPRVLKMEAVVSSTDTGGAA